jgi:predicted nucleotidyltransferase
MTVVDQRSRVPELDRRATESLIAALDREEVLVAFLIGSQARGSAGPLSDIDVAVLHSPGLSPKAAFALRLELARAAGAALGTAEVDIVVVNGASPLLRHRVAQDGRLLLDRDPVARVRFRADALRDYLDTEPMRTALAAGLRHRLEEGRFGRHTEH